MTLSLGRALLLLILAASSVAASPFKSCGDATGPFVSACKNSPIASAFCSAYLSRFGATETVTVPKSTLTETATQTSRTTVTITTSSTCTVTKTSTVPTSTIVTSTTIATFVTDTLRSTIVSTLLATSTDVDTLNSTIVSTIPITTTYITTVVESVSPTSTTTIVLNQPSGAVKARELVARLQHPGIQSVTQSYYVNGLPIPGVTKRNGMPPGLAKWLDGDIKYACECLLGPPKPPTTITITAGTVRSTTTVRKPYTTTTTYTSRVLTTTSTVKYLHTTTLVNTLFTPTTTSTTVLTTSFTTVTIPTTAVTTVITTALTTSTITTTSAATSTAGSIDGIATVLTCDTAYYSGPVDPNEIAKGVLQLVSYPLTSEQCCVLCYTLAGCEHFSYPSPGAGVSFTCALFVTDAQNGQPPLSSQCPLGVTSYPPYNQPVDDFTIALGPCGIFS